MGAPSTPFIQRKKYLDLALQRTDPTPVPGGPPTGRAKSFRALSMLMPRRASTSWKGAFVPPPQHGLTARSHARETHLRKIPGSKRACKKVLRFDGRAAKVSRNVGACLVGSLSATRSVLRDNGGRIHKAFFSASPRDAAGTLARSDRWFSAHSAIMNLASESSENSSRMSR